jgi:hypothetical protein
MAGTITADFIRSDANRLSLQVGNTVFASINAMGLLSNTGNVWVSQTGAITANNISVGRIVTPSVMPTGSVLQVSQARKTDASFSVAATTLTDITGLSVTMTPTSSSSKFLVYVDIFVGTYWWSTNGGKLGVTCNGTLIAGNSTDFWAMQYGADSSNSGYETMQWTDSVLYSPATSSSLTFNAQVAAGNGSYAMYINRSYSGTYSMGGRSVLTVMEIAG